MSVISSKVESFKQEGDLTTKCYYAIQLSAIADKTVKIAGAGSRNIGFIYANPENTSDNVAVVVSGGAYAIAGGTITRGDYLKSDGNGKLVVADTDKDEVCARALDSAVVNDILSVEIVKFTLSI